MTELDNFYLQQSEPIRSCFLALRAIILSQDKEIVNVWKYGVPFFALEEKYFAICGSIKNTANLTWELSKESALIILP